MLPDPWWIRCVATDVRSGGMSPERTQAVSPVWVMGGGPAQRACCTTASLSRLPAGAAVGLLCATSGPSPPTGGEGQKRSWLRIERLERGTDIRVIQALLGHDKLETTARYTRVATGMIAGIESPLDLLSHKRTFTADDVARAVSLVSYASSPSSSAFASLTSGHVEAFGDPAVDRGDDRDHFAIVMDAVRSTRAVRIVAVRDRGAIATMSALSSPPRYLPRDLIIRRIVGRRNTRRGLPEPTVTRCVIQ
jgi:hypothetical protein